MVLTATFVVYADLSVVNIAAPVIERQLRASVADLELMVAGYQVTYAAVLVTGGRLADILGCRRMFALGLTCFIVTSAACGLAGSAGELIGFRVLQGVSAALLQPQVVAAIQVALPPQRRAGAFSALGAVISLSTVAGPLLGGLLIGADIAGLGWRPVFFINVPAGIAALAAGARLMPAWRSQEARKLDVTGTLLVAAALTAVMVPLTLGQLYRWPPWTWLCLAAAAVLGPLFLWSQRRSERAGRDPLLPSALWRDKAFRAGLGLYFALFSGVTAFFLYYSVLVQSGYRITALATAVTTIPFGTAAAALSSFSGPLARRWGSRRVLAAGATICSLGFASLLLPVTQVRGPGLAAWTIPSQLVTGAGLGLVIAPLLGVVLAGIRTSQAGAASGLLSVALVIGGALGIGLMGLLFQSQLPGGLAAATAGQLRSGMTYSLLYNPVTFGISALIIITSFRQRRHKPAPINNKGAGDRDSAASGHPHLCRPHPGDIPGLS